MASGLSALASERVEKEEGRGRAKGEGEAARREETAEAGVGGDESAAACLAKGEERAAIKKLLISGKHVFALFLEGEEEEKVLSFSCLCVCGW